ncbi:hypothetical protein Tco_0248294, partial [Tanacetum coccineum]
DRGVTEGREDVREVFQQRGSGAKRKLSRCRRNQMGNEPILALPEGADDFVVSSDARSKDLEACLEKGRRFCPIMLEALSEGDSRWMKLFSEYGFEAKYHLGKANVVVESWSRKKSEAKNKFWIDCGLRFSNWWSSMKKNIASCGSKYSACAKMEVEYKGFSGLLLRPEIPEWRWEKITRDVIVKLPTLSSGYDAIGCRTVEFVDREVKSLKHNMIALVKVHWDSKRSPEFTWKRKDRMWSKCPQLFVDSDIASSS